jgi:hypothetical protein
VRLFPSAWLKINGEASVLGKYTLVFSFVRAIANLTVVEFLVADRE